MYGRSACQLSSTFLEDTEVQIVPSGTHGDDFSSLPVKANAIIDASVCFHLEDADLMMDCLFYHCRISPSKQSHLNSLALARRSLMQSFLNLQLVLDAAMINQPHVLLFMAPVMRLTHLIS